jgi:hypothetical protein
LEIEEKKRWWGTVLWTEAIEVSWWTLKNVDAVSNSFIKVNNTPPVVQTYYFPFSSLLFELHYARKKAESEDLKKRTLLPYKQGNLGSLVGLGSNTRWMSWFFFHSFNLSNNFRFLHKKMYFFLLKF